MVLGAIGEVKRNGRFDLVVCQAVLNSVDSLEAEEAVVGCCSLFCRDGGTLIISGRSREFYEASLRSTKVGSNNRRPEFLDENGFTALFRAGEWFFQKYHRVEDAAALIERMGFEIEFAKVPPEINNYWVVQARKVRELPKEDYRRYVDFEFELPWPDGSRVGFSTQVKELFSL